MKSTLLVCLISSTIAVAQVSVNRNFNLELAEKDSLTSAKLEASLNGFLTEAQANDYSSYYVDTNHLKTYEFFFHKLSRIGQNSSNFNAPSVLKSYTADGKTYTMTVAFTGVKDSVPFVYQITELNAVPYQDHYRFYCRFAENTENFSQKTVKNITYYYNGPINEQKAEDFAIFKKELSDFTKTAQSSLDYYCFNSLDELLKSYGFLYSVRQCNFLCYDLGFLENGGQRFVTGMNIENYISGYVPDYIYYSLENQEEIYWPVLEGLAIYYGGYGLKHETLENLKVEFNEALKERPDLNFFEEFKKERKSSINRHFCHYVICALLWEDVIKTKDFDEIMPLLYSGQKGDDFFEELEKLTGVTETNFHDHVVKLIGNSQTN